MGYLKLNEQDSKLLELADQATFANPFSKKRFQYDYQISGLNASIDIDTLIDKTTEILGSIVQKIEKKRKIEAKSLTPKQAIELESAKLYVIFYKHLDTIDLHIKNQIASPSKILPPDFAWPILADLAEWGFNNNECLHYLGIFFQARRAYFFIGHQLIGKSPPMQELKERLWDNVFTESFRNYKDLLFDRMEDFSTLLLGETGTGKGTVAKAIGLSSFIPFDQKVGQFKENFVDSLVSCNLSEFASSLVESELFGHKKGAFTGATYDYDGLFGQCSAYGAIFLDEIGDISLSFQVKLLSVLQERTFRPVGSHNRKRFQGRVITATHKNIRLLIEDNRLRTDFFYRICSDEIEIPSLSDRIRSDKAELPRLIEFVMEKILPDNTLANPIIEKAIQHLSTPEFQAYDWPGNVRELEQAVRQILLKGKYTPLRASRKSPPKLVKADYYLGEYLSSLYHERKSYEEVGRIVDLDRRTVKRYIEAYRNELS